MLLNLEERPSQIKIVRYSHITLQSASEPGFLREHPLSLRPADRCQCDR